MKKICFFLALALLSCKPASEEEVKEVTSEKDRSQITVNKEQFKANEMELAPVTTALATTRIHTTGSIDVPPENRVEVSPLMGGYVTYNPLLVGDRVKKGQLLFSLENPEFVTLQQNFLEEKQQLEYLREEYERSQKLLEEQITSRKSFLRAQSAYLSAKARYYGLQKQLQLLNLDGDKITAENISSSFPVYSPISGSVTEIGVSRGSFIPSSHPAMVIINSDHLHLELNVFEKDVLKVKKGQTIRFTIPEASDKEYPAEVHLISDALSEDRTVRVHGHIDDALKEQLVVGMYVEADILTDAPGRAGERQYLVPTAAVVERGRQYLLMVLNQENEEAYQFKTLEVTPGPEMGDLTVIIAPRLDTSMTVLAKGAFDLIR